MDESLTQRRRVREEAFRGVNRCQEGRTLVLQIVSPVDGTSEEAPANSVPAAAVRRRAQALFGITGRKAPAGGPLSPL